MKDWYDDTDTLTITDAEYIETCPFVDDERTGKVKRSQGFTSLRRQNPDLYRSFRNIIRNCMDRNDWCYLHANGKSKPRANLKDTLNYWLDNSPEGRATRRTRKGVPRIKELSLLKIEEHCNAIDLAPRPTHPTRYFTSHPTSHYALLMFDIDDKTGSFRDSEAELDYIQQTYFPTMYRQPSTFGKGSHGYIAVSYPEMPTGAFRELCKAYEDSMKLSVQQNGFGSGFELKGYPGHLAPSGAYLICGQQAKLPRLPTIQHIQHFVDACSNVYNSDALRSVLSPIGGAVVSTQPLGAIPDPSPSPVPSTERAKATESGKRSRKPIQIGEDDQCSTETPIVDELQRITLPSVSSLIDMNTVFISINEKNRGKECSAQNDEPHIRMAKCTRALAQQLRRPPTTAEILRTYDQLGLNTGIDSDGNRAALAEINAKWCARTYKPMSGEYDPIAYLVLIRQHVKPEHKGRRRTYTDEQLAIVLYTIEKGSTIRTKKEKHQFTVGNNSLMGMMRTLGHPLQGSENSNRVTCSAMKHVLENAGLIEQLDATWRFDVSKKYVVGPAHPRRSEYEQFKAVLDAKESR